MFLRPSYLYVGNFHSDQTAHKYFIMTLVGPKKAWFVSIILIISTFCFDCSIKIWHARSQAGSNKDPLLTIYKITLWKWDGCKISLASFSVWRYRKSKFGNKINVRSFHIHNGNSYINWYVFTLKWTPDSWHEDAMPWKCFPHYWFIVSDTYCHQWIPLQRVSNVEFWCLLWC